MNDETLGSVDFGPIAFRAPVASARDSEAPRPLWSVLIPTFNCALYLEQALRSVLRQDPGTAKMEILVLDDRSTQDDPLAVVQRLGGGRVKFIQQKEHVGKSRNFHTGLTASRGRLVHQLHGDDLVGSDFYRTMEDCFEAFSEAGAFFCEAELYIDERGQPTGRTGREREDTGLLDDWLGGIYVRQRIQSPSIVCRREVFEQLGGFDQRLAAFEDWEMWVRAATRFRFGFNAECTAQYRVSSEASSQSILDGKRAAHQKQMLNIVDSYVPKEIVRRWHRKRSREVAYYLVRCLPLTVRHRRPRSWLALCRQVASYSLHPRVWYHVLLSTCGYRKATVRVLGKSADRVKVSVT